MAAMGLKRAKRLPRKFNRSVSLRTRAFAQKRMRRHGDFRKERMRRWLRKLQRLINDWRKFFVRWFLVGLLCTSLSAGTFLLFSPVVQVRRIHVDQSSPLIDREEIQSILSPLFGRHLLFLSAFEVHALLRQLPEIHEVRVTKEYPSDLHVSATVDALAARLDIILPDGAAAFTGSALHLVTSEGTYVTVEDSALSEGLPLIRIVDWGAEPLPRSTLLSSDFLRRMNDAVTILEKQFGHTVESRTAFVRAREFHIDIGPYSLWFDMRGTLEEQLNRYRSLLAAVAPDSIKEYADLRIVQRVVYK